MAESELPPSTASPDLDAAIGSFIEQFFDPKKLLRLERAMRNAHAEGAVVAQAA
jgi:hypothetical protein